MGREYEIGYRRPPSRTRFRKGQSGNPKGRPKGTKNLKTDLFEELNQPISLREGNKEIRVTKQRAMVKSLMARSLKGDPRSAALLLNMMARFFDVAELDDLGEIPLSPDEQELLTVLEQRLGGPVASLATKTSTEPEDDGERS